MQDGGKGIRLSQAGVVYMKYSNTKYPVVGIDLSLTSTGVSFLWADGSDRIFSIKPEKLAGVARLVEIRNTLLKEMSGLGYPKIVLEGYSFASKGAYSHEIGELGGVVKIAFYEQHWRWVHVPPTVRAKFATGRGNASKGEVVSAISARTGIAWTGSGAADECDAWILQEMGLAYLGEPRYNWPEAQLAVLKSVDWSPWEEE